MKNRNRLGLVNQPTIIREFIKIHDMVADVFDSNLGILEIIASLEKRIGMTFSDEERDELQNLAIQVGYVNTDSIACFTQWIWNKIHK